MSEEDQEVLTILFVVLAGVVLLIGPVINFIENPLGYHSAEKRHLVAEKQWADKAASKKLEIANSLKVEDQLLNN